MRIRYLLIGIAIFSLNATVVIVSPLLAQDNQNKSFNASNPDEVKQAIEYLQSLSEADPDNANTKKELARAYNYYAVILSSGDLDMAIDYMRRATDVDPNNATYAHALSMLYLRRGYQYYLVKQVPKAIVDLKSALAVDPINTDALRMMGQIYFAENDFSQAVGFLSQASSAEPGNKDIAAMLELSKQGLDKAGSFGKRENQNFIFMFEQKLDQEKLANMENVLNEVYVKIGQDLDYFPTYRIPVQVFSVDTYRNKIQSSENIIGVYDGTIKVPECSQSSDAGYKNIVFHEYMHAIVYDLSGNKAPRWLHEGLATYEDPGFKPNPDLLRDLYKHDSLVNLKDIEGYFLDFNSPAKLNIAYQEANSLIRYFFSRHNFWHMKNILVDLKSGMDLDQAFKKEINAGLDDFFRQWQDEVLKNETD